jgi:hypothetical protein
MKKKIVGVIHQPNYFPWGGYFEQIIYSDIFVFFDNVQFPRRSWCSRNKIINNGTPFLLSVPTVNASREELIKDTKINNQEDWTTKHLKSIEYSYKNSPYFSKVFPIVKTILKRNYKYLAGLDIDLIESLCSYMGIKTKFYKASQKIYSTKRTELLRDICKNYQINHYYTSLGAKVYLDKERSILEHENIQIEFQNYQPAKYDQIKTDKFIPNLSVLDLLFNTEKEKALEVIKAGAVH